MDLGLKGRVAFVAAASKGLGRAIARALSMEGAKVAICARTKADIERAASEITKESGGEALPIVADVGKSEDVERVIAETLGKLGGLHIVVANGGGPKPGTFDALDEAAWRDAIDGTLLSTMRLFRAALPPLKAQRWGRLLVVTSISTREVIPGLLLSNTIRPGIVGFCKTLAKELGGSNITVNNVAPGLFDTDRLAHVHEHTMKTHGVSLEEARKMSAASIPLGRLGDPAELARMVAFLAGDTGSYVSGQTVVVDGGRTGGY